MNLPRNIPQKAIANRLGISVSTVSRALSDHSKVSKKTRDAVSRAIEELIRSQDQANQAGTRMIGLTHGKKEHGFHYHDGESVLEQVLGGVEEGCRSHGVIPYPWQQSFLLPTQKADVFFDRVSGVIVSGGELDAEIYEAIHSRGKPIVMIGGHLPRTNISSVAADSVSGMYEATAHLIQRGHRRIGFINGPPASYSSFEKKAGYLTALADYGISFDPDLLQSMADWDGLHDGSCIRLTGNVLAVPDPPTALIFAADAMARVGCRLLHERQISIPEMLAVVGFHDDHAQHAYPPMTSVRVDRFQWGIAAVDLLMEHLDSGCHLARRVLLPTTLIERESTAHSFSGD